MTSQFSLDQCLSILKFESNDSSTLEKIQNLLKDITVNQHYLNKMLSLAISSGLLETAKWLVTMGADIHNGGYTFFFETKKEPVLKWLISERAFPKLVNNDIVSESVFNEVLIWLSLHGSLALAKELIQIEPKFLDTIKNALKTLRSYEGEKNIDIISWLMSLGACVDDQNDLGDKLSLAAQNNLIKDVNMFLAKGASPSYKNSEAISVAYKSGNYDIVKILISASKFGVLFLHLDKNLSCEILGRLYGLDKDDIKLFQSVVSNNLRKFLLYYIYSSMSDEFSKILYNIACQLGHNNIASNFTENHKIIL